MLSIERKYSLKNEKEFVIILDEDITFTSRVTNTSYFCDMIITSFEGGGKIIYLLPKGRFKMFHIGELSEIKGIDIDELKVFIDKVIKQIKLEEAIGE